MKSQREKVLDHLIKRGRITNAQALRMGITRLPVMIERLRKEGYLIVHIDDGKRRYYDLIIGAKIDKR